MDTNDKLKLLRAEMLRQNVDAMIVPTGDPHQNEYLPEYYKSRSWISGFTGSAGTAVITMNHAGVWTDSRYFLQAEMQMANSEFQLHKLNVQGSPEYADWLVEHLGSHKVVGFDAHVMPLGLVNMLQVTFDEAGISVKTDFEPFDTIWQDRPALSEASVFELDVTFAGASRAEKIARMRDEMRKHKAEYYLVTALDDIAWLLNLRGRDIECNPVFISYVLFSPEKVYLFIDKNKVDASLTDKLQSDNIFIKDYEAIHHYVAEINAESSILISPASISYGLYQQIKCRDIIQKDSPIMLAKSIKNKVEQGHIKNAMIKDGRALTHFFMWLEDALKQGKTPTEYELSRQLIVFRSQQEGYYGESFDAIIGYRGNGAIIHYKPEKETSVPVHPEGVLLVDSGGQYTDGTTDITRTIALSEVSDEIKDHYTRVLKGHIAVAAAIFPKGTRGIQLDTLARQFLWQKKITYSHGTGHGVGFFLNVHEPPQGITNGLGERGITIIAPGSLTSNEPGYYKQDSHGIRTENLVICHETKDNPDFLYFDTVTVFPIDKTMIDSSIMLPDEINWLNSYHQRVYDELAPGLDDNARIWLKAKCEPLG
ncbi:MAG TPA: aminopeptidase P family protein [Saprospiraceae bacterium]|nr:aminopeptidase P family protein [Saprospiraceae bacterium]